MTAIHTPWSVRNMTLYNQAITQCYGGVGGRYCKSFVESLVRFSICENRLTFYKVIIRSVEVLIFLTR